MKIISGNIHCNTLDRGNQINKEHDTEYMGMNAVTEQQTIHAEGNHYTCDVCNKSFALRTTFRSHWRIHERQGQYSCNVCNKSFNDKSNLKKHQRLHAGERPFSCDVCGKSYSDQSNLKKHVRMHKDERLYSCDVCKKEFGCKVSMKQHYQRIHGISGKVSKPKLRISVKLGVIGLFRSYSAVKPDLAVTMNKDSGYSQC
ncbi:hypothetical protein Cfor_11496 [Coptotermes formosanus]|uniref:C2H2-type domain-containing protein n=1 Tax=Coptotermes formosanus TaxID=36987 RepID=A0A6L2Q708_COPFO|nr:hypothetical protein Cfor_11496 [Coptotermes formosanus]